MSSSEEACLLQNEFCKPESISPTADLNECKQLNELLNDMNKYNEWMTNDCISNTPIDTDYLMRVLNNFIYVVTEYQTDVQFENIHHKFDECNFSKCNILKRIYRNRQNTEPQKSFSNDIKNDSADQYTSIFMQIMDKIHCLYAHSFDMRSAAFRQGAIFSDRFTNKFFTNVGGMQYDMKIDEASTNSISYANDKIFGTGYMFKYDEKQEVEPTSLTADKYTYLGQVTPKFKDFKDELLNNPFATMSVLQFKSERKKASLHFNSRYCQNIINAYYKEWNIRKYRHRYRYLKRVISIEHILALLIYCNFDCLQQTFSKTYRKLSFEEPDNEIKQRHSNFYFFGKLMVESVNHLGKYAETKNRFYHGIGEELYFINFVSMTCHVPLSTSSVFEVAVHFAND
eukprot:153071_1